MASEYLVGEETRENTDWEVALGEEEVDGDTAARRVARSLWKSLLSAALISSSFAALAMSKEGKLFSTGAETFQRVLMLTGKVFGR